MPELTGEMILGLMDLGGSVVVALVFGWFCFKILSKFGGPFIDAQNRMAAAMSSQAQAMCNIQDTVHEFTGRDSSEHREILLALQVVGQELQDLNKRLADRPGGS